MVRPARLDDVPLLPAIEDAAEALFAGTHMAFVLDLPRDPPTESPQALTDGLLWVTCDAEDRPVGFLEAEVRDGWLHLLEMSVHPDHQRQGRARALMETALAEARARGLGMMSLTTDRALPWNAPAYARLGFRELQADERPQWLSDLLAREVALGFEAALRIAMGRPA
jgi:GNAT superfamily N-acetyltransferase